MMIATGSGSLHSSDVWPDCPYRVLRATRHEVAKPLPPSVLCAINYDGPIDEAPRDSRRVSIALPILHGTKAGEIWESRLPVTYGSVGLVDFADNGEVMMLKLAVPECDMSDIEGATARLYAELLRFTAVRGYPHLQRVWNFMGGINDGEGDAERYRHFNVGRHRAISAAADYERTLPAATAIGTVGGGITIIALAGRLPGRQVENPRQLSAFKYPRSYGARSPSFSRATLVPWADGAQLLVSGTASIVGHQSAHVGDAYAQLQQTVENLHALTSQPGLARRGFLPELYTLYLRYASDLVSLLPLIGRVLGGAPVQILRGDICRRDLLLEVEAIYRLPQVRSR